ncbi:MAG: thioredoxin domain-containing protein [Candidatus Woesearchaeota archaeon]
MEKQIRVNRVTIWKAVSIILGILLIIFIYTSRATIANSRWQLAQDGSGTAGKTQIEKTPPIDMAGLLEDDSVKGDPNAPVTIIEFSDFECPYCARFYQQTFDQIEEEYLKTGIAKIVFRDFPLVFHKNAQKAAEAAECAGEQGKYWEMHNILFEQGVAGGTDTFKKYAAELALNTPLFNTCLDSGTMEAEVKKDMQEGIAAGVKGTPAFIINGQLVSGAQPFENFKQVIDAKLAGVAADE